MHVDKLNASVLALVRGCTSIERNRDRCGGRRGRRELYRELRARGDVGIMSIIGFNIAALGKPVQIPLCYGNNNIGASRESDPSFNPIARWMADVLSRCLIHCRWHYISSSWCSLSLHIYSWFPVSHRGSWTVRHYPNTRTELIHSDGCRSMMFSIHHALLFPFAFIPSEICIILRIFSITNGK